MGPEGRRVRIELLETRVLMHARHDHDAPAPPPAPVERTELPPAPVQPPVPARADPPVIDRSDPAYATD